MRYADAGDVRIAYDDQRLRADAAVLCLPRVVPQPGLLRRAPDAPR